MVRHPQAPHCQITRNGLTIRCEHCKKSLSYQRGLTVGQWSKDLAEFVKRHRGCLKHEAP